MKTQEDMETIFLEFHASTRCESTFNWIYQLIEEYIQEVKDRGGNARIISEKAYEFDNITLLIEEKNAVNHFKEREGEQRMKIPYGDTGKRQIIITLYPEVFGDFEKDISCKFIDTQAGRDQRGAHYETYAQVTHKPTGIIATCGEEVGQMRNKEMAIRLLKAKVLKHYEQTL